MEILGIVTDVGRETFARQLANLETFSPASYFKIGEGGWIDPGTGRVPRDPLDARAFTDLDAILDASRPPIDQRYPVDDRYVFQKNFVASDLSYVADFRCRCRCRLETGEANDDGFGNAPEFWEIGVFDGDDRLLGYATFILQTKTAARPIENFVNFQF